MSSPRVIVSCWIGHYCNSLPRFTGKVIACLMRTSSMISQQSVSFEKLTLQVKYKSTKSPRWLVVWISPSNMLPPIWNRNKELNEIDRSSNKFVVTALNSCLSSPSSLWESGYSAAVCISKEKPPLNTISIDQVYTDSCLKRCRKSPKQKFQVMWSAKNDKNSKRRRPLD
jgi:hypothetical protein